MRSTEPQRGETPAISPWGYAPLGLTDVRQFRHPGLRPGLSSLAPLGQSREAKHIGFRPTPDSSNTNLASPYRYALVDSTRRDDIGSAASIFNRL
jgi:hypothetical protein